MSDIIHHLESQSSNRATLLGIPRDLRFQIFAHLLPTRRYIPHRPPNVRLRSQYVIDQWMEELDRRAKDHKLHGDGTILDGIDSGCWHIYLKRDFFGEEFQRREYYVALRHDFETCYPSIAAVNSMVQKEIYELLYGNRYFEVHLHGLDVSTMGITVDVANRDNHVKLRRCLSLPRCLLIKVAGRQPRALDRDWSCQRDDFLDWAHQKQGLHYLTEVLAKCPSTRKLLITTELKRHNFRSLSPRLVARPLMERDRDERLKDLREHLPWLLRPLSGLRGLQQVRFEASDQSFFEGREALWERWMAGGRTADSCGPTSLSVSYIREQPGTELRDAAQVEDTMTILSAQAQESLLVLAKELCSHGPSESSSHQFHLYSSIQAAFRALNESDWEKNDETRDKMKELGKIWCARAWTAADEGDVEKLAKFVELALELYERSKEGGPTSPARYWLKASGISMQGLAECLATARVKARAAVLH